VPAGDQIAQDWQLEINGLLTGAGTPYGFGEDGIQGMFTQRAKTQDVDLAGRDGVFANADYKDATTILVDYEINDSDSGAFSYLVTLRAPSPRCHGRHK
jgi:hypothetical protein